MSVQEKTGEVDFSWPAAGKPCKTWYRIVGDLSVQKCPLVVLHGGPGLSPDYVYPIQDLWTKYGRPVVFYNQIGSGRSTHIREKNGDGSFWVEELFVAELENILTKLGIGGTFDLIGHSWGGMLASAFASNRPKGLRRLIISNSPVDMTTWVEGCMKWFKTLPQELQQTIEKHESAGTTDSEEYEQACLKFYELHTCRISPLPAELFASLEVVKDDPTVYHTMNGPSEFHVIGSLIKPKPWSTEERVKNINVPTLLINGRYDMAQDNSQKGFFKNIPKIRWVRFEQSSHCPHFEERERYMELVADFLDD